MLLYDMSLYWTERLFISAREVDGLICEAHCHPDQQTVSQMSCFFFSVFTLVTGPRRLSLELHDTRVYARQIRARLGPTADCCEVVVLELRTTAQIWLGVEAVSYLHAVDFESFFGAKFRALRDQICTTQGPEVHCVEESRLLMKGS